MSFSKPKPKSVAHHTSVVERFLRSSTVAFQKIWRKVQALISPEMMLQLNNLSIERNPRQESEMERQIWIILELFKAMVERELANLSTETTSSHHLVVEHEQFLQKLEHADRVCIKVRKIFLIDNSAETRSSIEQAVFKLLGM